MRRRRVLIVAGVLVALAVVVAVSAVLELRAANRELAQSRFIDEEHFGRIRHGMPLEEVEIILGRPPDVMRPRTDGKRDAVWRNGKRRLGEPEDQIVITITIDERGASGDGVISNNWPDEPPSPLENVRDWLRSAWP
jgi:hypothetical protein